MISRTTVSLLAALTLFFGALTGGPAAQESPAGSPTPPPTLLELKDIDQLRDLFNRQAGVPRLILLVAPT